VVTPETMRRLQEYAWPGNIRELENVLERAVILATGTTLDIAPDLLPVSPPPNAGESNADPSAAAPDSAQSLSTLDAIERDHILSVLRQTNWLITGSRGAAKVLGVHANTLRNRMKKLGISRPAH